MVFILPTRPLTPRQLAANLAPATRIVRAADMAAFADAQALIADAHCQADRIMEGARAAFEQQRELGYREGKDAALVEVSGRMMEAVAGTVDYFSRVEGEIVNVVMAAVRKIVHEFDDREKTAIAVRGALAVLRNQKQVSLRLHPDEIETVREKLDSILSAYPAVSYLDLVADSRVGRGACILESEIGVVEASLEGQMRALEEAFERTFDAGAPQGKV